MTRLPLQELWRDDGFITSSRGRWLTDHDITTFLRAGPVQFVVVDVGVSPRWIQISGCYEFWKEEVRDHRAAPNEGAQLDRFPGSYCYSASEVYT